MTDRLTAREAIAELRSQGYSYKDLERMTGVNNSYWSQVGRGAKSGEKYAAALGELAQRTAAGDTAPPASAKSPVATVASSIFSPIRRRAKKDGTPAGVRRQVRTERTVNRTDRKTGEKVTVTTTAIAKETSYTQTLQRNLKRHPNKVFRLRVTFHRARGGKSAQHKQENVEIPLFENGYSGAGMLDLMAERGQSMRAFLEDQARASGLVSEASGIASIAFEMTDKYD